MNILKFVAQRYTDWKDYRLARRIARAVIKVNRDLDTMNDHIPPELHPVIAQFKHIVLFLSGPISSLDLDKAQQFVALVEDVDIKFASIITPPKNIPLLLNITNLIVLNCEKALRGNPAAMSTALRYLVQLDNLITEDVHQEKYEKNIQKLQIYKRVRYLRDLHTICNGVYINISNDKEKIAGFKRFVQYQVIQGRLFKKVINNLSPSTAGKIPKKDQELEEALKHLEKELNLIKNGVVIDFKDAITAAKKVLQYLS